MKSVLITGASGFIGSNLVYRMLQEKYEVHVVVKHSTDLWRLQPIIKKIHIHTVSLFQLSKLGELFADIQPEIIIHLAAYGSTQSQSNIKQIMKTNIEGFQNILLASSDIPYKLCINTGSSSEYGFNTDAMKESDALHPVSFYAVSKAAATYFSQVFARQYSKPVVNVRPFSVYGPYEPKQRFIPTIMKACIEQKPIQLTPGSIRRDFIYIDDLVDLYLALIDSGKFISGEVFNGGTGVEYTNDEVVEQLEKVVHKRLPMIKGSYPAHIWDTQHWRADISFSKEKLKWKPKYSLSEGLQSTYAWFLKHYELYT